MMPPQLQDPHHPDRVAAEPDDRLRAFNDAGVLAAADIHTARRLGMVTGTDDADALLAAAFAVRAPRYGHVHAQLDELAGTVADDDGRIAPLDPAVWPADVDAWVAAVAASGLVASGAVGDGAGDRPLRLDGRRLYLDRYWRYEQHVVHAVRDRLSAEGPSALRVAGAGWAAIDAVHADDADQRAAACAALTTRLSVIAGGPGTGKTRTITTVIATALAHATRPDGRPARVAVAAPTGKAAARLGEALREAAGHLPADLAGTPGSRRAAVLAGTAPTTLHRLLGWTPVRTRFRHDATRPLPVDLVIVDEVSMVSLAMLSRLLEAVPPAAHLVLVGDPDQLAAVEAGTVLGDLVAAADGRGPLRDHVTTLRRGYRYDDRIAAFAAAVRDGDADGALDCLTVDPADLASTPLALVVPDDPGAWPTGAGPLAGVRELLVADARAMVAHALAGDAPSALAAALRTKVLCAHRRGPDGVQAWNSAVEGWVHDLPPWRRPEWYAGRPVMVTANDHDLGVYNGDVGVAVLDGDRLRVVVDGRDRPPIERRRLAAVQTVHAMTVHKSQGSQFDRVVVVLPADASPVLSRELLYTAVTRARSAVTVVGTPDAVRAAVSREVARASALAERLRG